MRPVAPGLRHRWAVAQARRPDWPAVLLVVVAWVALVVLHLAAAGGSGGAGGAHAGHPGHLGHAGHAGPAGVAGGGPTAGGGTVAAAAVAVGGWTLMAAAMMIPATLPAVRHVGRNSIRARRRRAVALYVAAYLGVWVAFGVVALALAAGARAAGAGDGALALAVLAVAAAWQLTRTKRRALTACRRTVPLPPEGRRADAACLRFGVRQAVRCAVSCWPLMLLMAVAGHAGNTGMAVMVVVTVVVVGEERTAWGRRLAGPGLIARFLPPRPAS